MKNSICSKPSITLFLASTHTDKGADYSFLRWEHPQNSFTSNDRIMIMMVLKHSILKNV